MSIHQYSPEQALDLLMRKVQESDQTLAALIQAAINAGKDVSETEQPSDRRKRPRVYRKSVAYTHEEALLVALDALEAYFVEQPLFVASLEKNLAKTSLGVPYHPSIRGS